VKEVAGLLRLSLGSTYALIRDGSIPAKKMGARWVIPKKRFHAWLDECVAPADYQPMTRTTWREHR
jgi:excisionase family DNA binding protein